MTCRGYLLDTGVFIQAHRNYYSLDLAPGFWDALRHFQREGLLRSLDRVKDEIHEGDALSKWVSDAAEGFFASSAAPEIAAKYAELMAWANSANFTDAAKAEFASGADGWLVAYAAVHELTLITHETYEPARLNRVKIPNACEQFSVEWANTFRMLRDLGIQLDWSVP